MHEPQKNAERAFNFLGRLVLEHSSEPRPGEKSKTASIRNWNLQSSNWWVQRVDRK